MLAQEIMTLRIFTTFFPNYYRFKDRLKYFDEIKLENFTIILKQHFKVMV